MAKKSIRPKNPTTVFNCCQKCKSKNIHKMEVDVFCFDCDWNSWENYIESGGMDDLNFAYYEHFGKAKLTEEIYKSELSEGERCEAI